MVAGFEMRTGKDLKRIGAELRKMDNKQLKKEFGSELRSAAKPMVPAVRAAIRQIPSSRGYSADGLRGRMSKAVKLEVKLTGKQAGVRIRVDGRKMPTHEKALQAYMEGLKKPWRHPVYGNKEVWVKQDPSPYFYKTVRPLGTRTRVNVNRAMDRVAKKIT
ncbi:hypothetical protein LXH13_06120 [Streptomyces spinosirectus]|jgi:hypothetical protein|uniref:hypothetical protein n=1 Tax=Streptomyces TaxID=1883 RepID=UPI000FFF3D1F|nr:MULTISPECIES: hypothetical protein [Streptomyces]MBY8342019.1 hypothetical protein [Streptomyces plumbidurans]UIR16634.1 hypothetical protein LXH13_06120 [Streptomyces spinosirectus]